MKNIHFAGRALCALTILAMLCTSRLSAQAWKMHTPPFGDTIGIADIEVVSDQIIWAVGNRNGVNDSLYTGPLGNESYYAVTSDGGATWKTGTIPMGTLPFIANMAATDAGTALVIGLENFGNAKTLKTMDGGTTWEVSDNNWDPVVSWPDYIHAFSPAKMCVIGDPRNGEFEIYTTANAGQVWVRVAGNQIANPLSGEFGYNNCGATVGNKVWFGTNLGRVYRSSNAGLNWEAAQTPLESVGLLSFSDADHGVVSSGYGLVPISRLCTTADGGITWKELPNLPYAGHFLTFGVSYIPEQSYMILGLTTGGNLSGTFETWRSADRGITWQQISTGEIIGWPTFLNGKVGWAGEFQQLSHPTRLFQYTGGPLVGLLTPDVLEADVTLSPNPASNVVRVQVRAEEVEDFWVMLYDAQGNLLRKIEVAGVDTFDKELNISDLPIGVYTLTVSGAKGSISRTLTKS